MDKPEPKDFTFANHDSYYEIALQNRNSSIRRKLIAAGLQSKHANDEDVVPFQSDLWLSYEHSIVCVVFCAMAAEAFINYYAINRMSKSQFKHYDNLNLLVKWTVIPLVITSKSLDRGGTALQRLNDLIELRNKLVHYKSVSVESPIKFAEKGLARPRTQPKESIKETFTEWMKKANPALVSPDDVENAVEAVKELVNGLAQLDPSTEFEWVNDEYEHYNKIAKRIVGKK